MDNKTALFLGLFIVGFFVLDAMVLGWNTPVFITRKIAELIEVMAFWR